MGGKAFPLARASSLRGRAGRSPVPAGSRSAPFSAKNPAFGGAIITIHERNRKRYAAPPR